MSGSLFSRFIRLDVLGVRELIRVDTVDNLPYGYLFPLNIYEETS